MRINFAGRRVSFELGQERGQQVIRLGEATLFRGEDGLISGVAVPPGPGVALRSQTLQERQRRAIEQELKIEDEVGKLVGRSFDETVSWLRSLAC